jgi:hypothetical protein
LFTCSVQGFFEEVLLVAVDGDTFNATHEVDGGKLPGSIKNSRLIRNTAEVHVVIVEHKGAKNKYNFNFYLWDG